MNMHPCAVALAAVFLGIGILIACFLPAAALVVVVCLAVIAVGISYFKR